MSVSGSGSWKLQRFSPDDAATAKVKGWAAITFDGTATHVSLSGMQYVIGEASTRGVPRPMRFENVRDGRLVISRPGRCKAAGHAAAAQGAAFTWSATLKGSDGCGL
jgi:hypothetical protein